MNTEPFVIERTYDSPVETVWSAITNKEEMQQWFFKLEAFRPEVGFTFHFWGQDGDLKFEHECVVTEVVPLKKLSYSWRYIAYEGNSLVSFELFAEGQKTRLVLTHTGLETFPSTQASFRRESFSAGWTHLIGKNLKAHVEKK